MRLDNAFATVEEAFRKTTLAGPSPSIPLCDFPAAHPSEQP
jgi:hypothetical protein